MNAAALRATDYSYLILMMAVKTGALRAMDTAPIDRVILAAVPDDQAPNQEKLRCVRVRFNHDAWYYLQDRSWIDLDSDGASISEDELEGWCEP